MHNHAYFSEDPHLDKESRKGQGVLVLVISTCIIHLDIECRGQLILEMKLTLLDGLALFRKSLPCTYRRSQLTIGWSY